MEKLTPHFSRSEIACPCCGLANVDQGAIEALEAFRVYLGRPVRVSSGVRCPDDNMRAGGAKKSFHVPREGQAACAFDIYLKPLKDKPAISPAELMSILESWDTDLRFKGRGIYPKQGIIHIDTRGPASDQLVISRWWSYSPGHYSYVHQFEYKGKF